VVFLYPIIMKPIIKFEIGEEYGLYEFELEFRYSYINQQGYEYMVYKYLGNDVIDVLGCEIKQPILLAYNADILSHIIIYVAGSCFSYLNSTLFGNSNSVNDNIKEHRLKKLVFKFIEEYPFSCLIISDIKHSFNYHKL